MHAGMRAGGLHRQKVESHAPSITGSMTRRQLIHKSPAILRLAFLRASALPPEGSQAVKESSLGKKRRASVRNTRSLTKGRGYERTKSSCRFRCRSRIGGCGRPPVCARRLRGGTDGQGKRQTHPCPGRDREGGGDGIVHGNRSDQ